MIDRLCIAGHGWGVDCRNVSVLGLGIIGSIWAGHYGRKGVLAACWNRTPAPDFPGWIGDPAEAVRRGDVAHLCLYGPDSVAEVLERMGPALGEGKVVVQSSTIDPRSADRFAAQVRRTGARYVEAPFTGSKPAAEERQTVFFLGGDPLDLDAVEPILSLVSRRRFRFGSPKQAATIKLAMNHQISAITEALCEGVSWARAAGLSDGQFFDVLRENVAWSGLAELKEGKIRDGDFSPQFSVRNMHKDMRLAVDSCPLELPTLPLVRDRLRRTEEAGFGDEDFVSLIRVLG